MASVDRYRPGGGREGYQPPTVPPNRNRVPDRNSKSPLKRREVPPAVPSPPTLSSRTSPPRPHSRRSAPSPPRSTPPRSPGITMENQWAFTTEEIVSSPSIIDGLSPAEERLRRAKGVNFIYQAGVLLDLPQITLYVAGVFFHRFYMRVSMVEEKGGIHHYNIAATALFLANKTEENCRRTKEIIIAVAKVAQKNSKLIIDEQSKEYWRWRDSILLYEEVMLENLTFDLVVENPHIKLYEFLGVLGIVHNKPLRHAAWAFCNDSCLTPLPLLMGARDIALASILFSATFTGETVEDVNGQPWWKSLQGREELVLKAIKVLQEFYTENPLRKQENPYQNSPEFNLENTRKKGGLPTSAAGSSNDGTPRMDVDRATQSPKARTTGDPTLAPGNSDAALKEAASIPENHEGTHANENGLLSPGVKRKEVETLASEDGSRKRQRTDDDEDDEGEVHE